MGIGSGSGEGTGRTRRQPLGQRSHAPRGLAPADSRHDSSSLRAGDVGAMSLAGAHAGLALPSALASPLPVGLGGAVGSPSTVGMGGVPQVDMTPMQARHPPPIAT